MTCAHSLLIGQAMGWIECMAFAFAVAFVAIYVLVNGRFPKIRFPGPLDGPGDE